MTVLFDLDLTTQDVAQITSADALAAFFLRMGYSTNSRRVIPSQALGIQASDDIQHIELLAEDAEGFLRVIFVRLRSVTAKARNLLVRTFGKQTQDYLLVLTSDFEALEFVLIEKLKQRRKGPGDDVITTPQAKVFVIPRRYPQGMLRNTSPIDLYRSGRSRQTGCYSPICQTDERFRRGPL